MKHLIEYHWPGNVRELENAIERVVILADRDTITVDNLPFIREDIQSSIVNRQSSTVNTLSTKKAQDILEQELIKEALLKTKGNKSRAAKLLEISYRALLYKLKEYRME